MDNFYSRLVLLLICILSRLLSSINYLEDTEGLQMALSVLNDSFHNGWTGTESFNLLFILVSKGLYFVIRDLAVVYSIVGGISLYFIIQFTLKLINVPLLSLEGFLTGLLLFFNPMIWIMSNQYLPDLVGVAIVISAIYYLIPETYKSNDVLAGSFLMGILGGVKPLFYPILIIPFIYAFITKEQKFKSFVFLTIGLFTWILPVLYLMGWNGFLFEIQKMIHLNLQDLNFNLKEYGVGGMLSGLVQSIWADGLGGYWADRSISLLITSIGIASCLFFGFFILLNFDKDKFRMLVLMVTIFSYLIWIFFFGDIVNQSSPILPVIPFLAILMAYGIIYFLVNFNFIFIKVFALLFILGNIFLTVVLVVQHTYPSAVAQAKEHILNRKSTDESVTIVAPEKLSEFLASQNIKAKFVPASEDSIFSTAYKIKNSSDRIIIVGFSSPIKDRNVIHFSHNPYVNRKWPKIFLYEYTNR